MQQALTGYEEMTRSQAWVRLEGVGILELTGEDRIEWLQGQLTQDVVSNAQGMACLCSATGQLESIIRFSVEEERVLLSAEPPEPMLRRAEEMVIMEDVTIRDLGPALTVQGPDALRPVDAVPSDRSGFGGWDAPVQVLDAPEASAEALDLASLEARIPRTGIDSTAKTLPPELGDKFLDLAVSPAKGCYVGQEVLTRIRTRGRTNRMWVVVKLDSEAEAGAVVSSPSREKAGSVTRCCWSPKSGWIAGAMIRNDAIDEGQLTVDGRSLSMLA
jgi:folate-binding protein YgfZ